VHPLGPLLVLFAPLQAGASLCGRLQMPISFYIPAGPCLSVGYPAPRRCTWLIDHASVTGPPKVLVRLGAVSKVLVRLGAVLYRIVDETVTRATHAVNTDLGHGIASRVPVAWEKIWGDLNPCAVEEKHSGITHNTLAIGMYTWFRSESRPHMQK
jgi:hypothetical protein